MARSALVLFLVAAILGLSGFNNINGRLLASEPEPVRTAAGDGCAAEIDRFQAIVTSDHETGNVDEKVYQQIEVELSRASAACVAGKAGEAHAIVAASKARHGYRA